MPKLVINGARKLQGEIRIHGAKNSTLPLMAASLVCGGKCVLHNCPLLSDVDTAIRILRHLGCSVTCSTGKVEIDPLPADRFDIPDHLMREMRSSIIFLGAIVSRMGKALLSFPGGCELGPRPIDLHLSALRKMGVTIDESHGCLDCSVPDGLKGANINLSFPSVGATENIIIAAVLAKGETVITNAAREPEIWDLADFLNSCGAKIRGAGGSTIFIEGVSSLSGCEHRVIPDRIAAATYLAAAAATGSRLTVSNIIPEHLEPVFPAFEESGCRLELEGDRVRITAPDRLNRIRNVRTMPYPGFPTDAQAPVMAMTSIADGTSIFVENIFESRYKHVGELMRLGAHIKVEGRVAVVEGVSHLSGACVEATDLRGGAALVVAGLAARGVTEIRGLHHLDRGYEFMEENLASLGAHIKRIQ
ncbi:MAG: UDP-N-acetylglucosamine 1-carboxyvinyltransferase [Oscillospiraceae bacterium]|jgi:UDP-N-acetylglucosamine 1-carboxyvinyltransferase|nr:UDP-N-acetylglucosamine 1-carboxyvinyltransferase [Oscillospiraceae bacterium]